MVDNISNISALTQSSSGKGAAKARVVAAIKEASQRTGVDFTYLVNKASQESSFNPEAKAARSSAIGLFQFIDQTWLKTIKANGSEYGLGELADKISVGSDGVARVANAEDRKAILELRKNPEISSLMAAELAKDNKESLQREVGGKVGSTEMYLAHFLGSGGAADLLSELKSNPNAKAADILPQAASANKSVFYDSETGEARSVSDIYIKFAKKFNKSIDLGVTDVQVAQAQKMYSSEVAATTRSAEVVEHEAATSIAMNSLSQTTGGVSLSNGVTLDQKTTSPFAAMMLAQMDMETFGLDAQDYMTKMGGTDDERRKSVLSTLANAA